MEEKRSQEHRGQRSTDQERRRVQVSSHFDLAATWPAHSSQLLDRSSDTTGFEPGLTVVYISVEKIRETEASIPWRRDV